MELLQAIAARLDRSGVPDAKFPDAKGEYWAHCPMPGHNDRNPTNFSVSLRGFRCFGCNARGSLATLAKTLGIAVPRRAKGCTLEDYAKAKRLPPGFLKGLGLRDGDWFGRPAVDIPYKDEAGKLLRLRKRIALAKDRRAQSDNRFRWEKGSGQYLYGLWRFAEIEQAGWVILLEGESDCHTAWLYDLPALGVPGANNWNKAKGDLLPRLQALQVYVWREPDQGGDKFIQSLQRDLPGAKVVVPGDDLKDISEAHCKGLDVPALLESAKAAATPILQIKALSDTADSLAAFAPWVHEKLGERADRETKVAIADALSAWFLAQKRFVVDLGQDQAKGGRAYVVADDGALWPIDKTSVTTRRMLYEAGLNGTESVYAFVVEALTMEALRAGRRTTLARWQIVHQGVLYVSSGPCQIVSCRNDQLTMRANGTDDVWFAGDACYPAWEIATPVDPLTLKAFNPNLITPPEVPDYTPEVQRHLLTVWMAGLVSSLRPLPLLGSVGEKGGGKTTLVRATIRMLLGPEADVTAPPKDVRDFRVQLTTAPLVGIDNMDTEVPSWLLDEMASTLTGRNVEERELFTNDVKLSRPATAAVGVTTRSASFCRPDIAERTLPILSEEFGDPDRQADSELLAEVAAHRDGLLCWCTRTAAALLVERLEAPAGLPLRFVDFARLVWAHMRRLGRPTDAAHMLLALRRAQALTVGEADPLVEALVVHFGEMAPIGVWQGIPADLAKDLGEVGADLPYLGGGKRIARMLREAKKTLEVMGFRLQESRQGNQTIFILEHRERTMRPRLLDDDTPTSIADDDDQAGGLSYASGDDPLPF